MSVTLTQRCRCALRALALASVLAIVAGCGQADSTANAATDAANGSVDVAIAEDDRGSDGAGRAAGDDSVEQSGLDAGADGGAGGEPGDGGAGGDVADTAAIAADVTAPADDTASALLDVSEPPDVADATEAPDVADATEPPDVADTSTPCTPPKITSVMLFIVDGLQAAGLASLIQVGSLPNFARLAKEGAFTHNARCDFSHSITLPNMTSMMSGRPVSAVAGQSASVFHGYTANVDPPAGATVHNAGNPALPYVPSIFDVAHDAGLRTGLYASKTKFVLFDTSWDAAHGAADLAGPDNGTDKVDVFSIVLDSAKMTDDFLAASTLKPFQFVFLHYANPDAAGHASGWGSPAWQQAVIAVDKQLGRVLDHVEANAALAGQTVVLLTSDHGGMGTNHSDATLPSNYTIPFYAWGAGIAAGVDLYSLVPGRTLPGTTRPDYTVAAQPLRNGDAANIATGLLGLPPVPGALMVGAGLQAATCPQP